MMPCLKITFFYFLDTKDCHIILKNKSTSEVVHPWGRHNIDEEKRENLCRKGLVNETLRSLTFPGVFDILVVIELGETFC